MNKEKLLTLIHSPYITEKATSIGSLNQVVFKVDLSASNQKSKKLLKIYLMFKLKVSPHQHKKAKQKETDLEYIKDQITKKPLFH